MGNSIGAAHDPSVADRALSHEVRKCRRATSPRAKRAGWNVITTVITRALVWNAQTKSLERHSEKWNEFCLLDWPAMPGRRRHPRGM
jgi:hypothetical protein